jgi:WD40 repeat protein
VAECIRQVDILLTEKERLVMPEHFELVGGFSRVLQVQGDRLVSQLSININPLKIKRFFQCFLKQDEQGVFNAIPLSASAISDRTNLSENQVSEILMVAELPEYQFVRQETGRYVLASRVMLTHWEEMKQWVLEEQEFINMYLRTKKQAVLYSNGEAELLTSSNLDAALLWLEQADPTLAWAAPYAPEYEPTLAYIEASSKQRQAHVAAEQRRAKQLLKITRGIAFVIGIAFIISSLAAVFAGVERNQAVDAKINAETERLAAVAAKEQAVEARELAEQERQKALSARNAEQEAKVRAESQRMVALLAKEAADQERLKAVDARNAEQQAKEEAERDRVIAISAKDQAEVERQNATSARSEEQKALARANENFKNAEKLRIQQESRANALSAYQYYNNNQAVTGLKLAQTAYTTNLANGGNPYERDILKSLVYGLNAQQPDLYAHPLNHPLRNVAVAPTGPLIAACSIGGLISVFQNGFSKIAEIKIAGQKFQSMCFSGAGELLVGTTNGELLVFDAASGQLTSKRLLSDQPIRCLTLLDPTQHIVALVSGRDILLLNGLSEHSAIAKNTGSTSEVPGEMVYSAASGQLFVSLGEAVFALNVENGRFNNTLKSIVEVNYFVTSIAVASFQGREYLLTGDKKGNISLVDAVTGAIKLKRKIHLSSVSGCHMEALNDRLLIATTGYDHQVFAHYAAQRSDGQFELEASIDFDFHHGWVTDMAAQPSLGTILTCSKDMTLRIWQFKPRDVFSQVEAVLEKEK